MREALDRAHDERGCGSTRPAIPLPALRGDHRAQGGKPQGFAIGASVEYSGHDLDTVDATRSFCRARTSRAQSRALPYGEKHETFGAEFPGGDGGIVANRGDSRTNDRAGPAYREGLSNSESDGVGLIRCGRPAYSRNPDQAKRRQGKGEHPGRFHIPSMHVRRRFGDSRSGNRLFVRETRY